MTRNHIKTVLLVDDDENEAFLLSMTLERAKLSTPIRLVSVRGGQHAVDYLDGNHYFNDRNKFPLPDLILLDLKMPVMNGFEFLEWLRNESALRDMTVWVRTCSHLQGDRERVEQLGANGFWVKEADPAGDQKLWQAIEEFLSPKPLKA